MISSNRIPNKCVVSDRQKCNIIALQQFMQLLRSNKAICRPAIYITQVMFVFTTRLCVK